MTLPRVAQRPSPADWRDDEPMLLAEYIAVFYPNGPLTVSSLRGEIRKRRLPFSEVAGKHWVTPADVKALWKPTCLGQLKGHGSTSAKAESTDAPSAPSPTSGSSSTARERSALAAIQMGRLSRKERGGNSRNTSPRNSRRQAQTPQTADVIPIR